MYTRTIEKTVYTFEDIQNNEDFKNKVLENNYDINTYYRWWEFIYEDAKEIGLQITAFDFDHYCKGYVIYGDPSDVKKLILEKHGKDCETYKTVKKYDLRKIDQREEMIRELFEDYRIMLRREYEYLTSEEAILETIESNGYEFDENGKIC